MSLRESVERARRTGRRPVWRRLAVGVPAAAAVVVVLAVIGVFSSSSSGEHFQLALASPVANGPSGNATLTKTTSGWRVELDASGLPRLDNGRFYEAWLRNDAGVLV